MTYPWTSGASTRLDVKVNPVYTIAATAGAGGTITPSGNVAVPFGANQAFAIAANPGYSIADVLVDSVSQGPITGYTFTNVQANHTISATFVQQTFTITPTAGANGSISPATPQVVPSGGSAAFTITPDACYTIADVLVDGTSVGAVASYTFNNVQASHTIHATFVRLSYTIAASAGAGGTITPSGNVAVLCGANQAFAIAPGTGYNIADVVVDGISQGAVGSYTFTNVQANHTISAAFALKTFVITPTAGTGGSISPATPQTVSYGGNKGFTITPDGCHTIANVLVDGVSVGAVPSYTFTNVTTAHTIQATFAHSGVSYTIAASAGAGGLIAPSGNVSVLCGANQAFAVAVTPGYYISDVLVDGASVGAVSSYPFTNVQANHTISASFTRQTYVITPSAGAGGSISPATPQTIPSGGSATFTITPSACYMIADVLVDGASVGAVSSHTFTDVQAAHTISASFTRLSYTIAASAGVHGTITPSGNVSVLCGANQAFAIAANGGFGIQNVLVDGVSVGAVTSYTFNDVQAIHTIAAQFSCPTGQFPAPLGTGWNLFSTPVRLESGSDTLAAIFTPAEQAKLDIVFRWDPASEQWVLAQGTYQLTPLDALYVKVKTGASASALLVPSTSPTGLPARSLSIGMNLIGPAPAFNPTTCSFPAMPVNQALTTVYWASGGLPGYSMAVSPGLNQTGWTYFRDAGAGPNMDPYKGYWVVMDNADTLFGSSTTPLVP